VSFLRPNNNKVRNLLVILHSRGDPACEPRFRPLAEPHCAVVLYMTEAWGQHAPVFSTICTIEHLYAFKRTGTAPKHLQHSCVAHLCKTLAGAQKLFKSIVENG
jgi:hypothetical protein